MADRFDKQQNDQDIRNRVSFGGSTGGAQDFANGAMAGGAGREQRAQSLGAAMGQRQAYQNDFTQANQSRAGQQDAAGLMRSAAYGNQPSQAQLLGRNMIDQSLQAQMAGAASARGGALAQAAAMRGAANQAGAMQQQGMNQLSALRAQEMAQARGEYFGAQTGMRGQDLGQQGMQMQSELAQRQMNQQGQLAYEQLGQNAQQFGDQQAFNALAQQQQGMLARQAQESQEFMNQQQINQHSQDRETGVIGAAIGGAGSLLGGAIDAFSDISAKTDIEPIGPAPMSASDASYVAKEQARFDTLNASEAAYAKQHAKPGIGSAIAQGFGRFGAGMGAMPITPIGARAAGGPVAAGRPYLVGEEGPELVIPKQDGDVLPAHVTRSAMAPMSGPAPATFDKLGGGGMDVMGSLKAHSAFATKYQRDPSGGMMMSDNRAKLAEAWDQGHAAAIADVEKAARYTPEQLRAMSEGDAYHPAAAAVRGIKAGAFDEGSAAGALGESRARSAQETAEMEARMNAYKRRKGLPLTFKRDTPEEQEAIAQANRSMAGSAYSYKPEFTPPEQAPGERNVGPMAQNMAADPVASTAVKRDPATGMLMLDGAKMTKLNSAGIASLQQQVDGLAAAVARRKK